MYPSTMPPMRLGIKKVVRKILVPGTFWVSTIATAKAMTLIKITVTTVKAEVKRKA